MDNKSDKITEVKSYYPLLLTLVIFGIVAAISGMLSGLLLIDIGDSFNVTVGIAGQLNTFSSIISIVFALLTSIFSVKYNHKTLLQIGLLMYIASAIGCYLSPNFNTMITSFSLTGVGFALTTTMAFTLTAELFPLEKRGEAIGGIFAGMSISYIVGALAIPYLQNVGGWRASFLYYMLPSSAIALILATVAIQRRSSGFENKSQVNLGEGFKNIFSNRSALFSLFGNLLAMATWQGILTYNISFFRESFLISIGEASIFILIGSILYTIGSVISGRMVNRLGRKPLTAMSILVSGIVFTVYSYLPTFLISAVVVCVGWFLLGVRDTAATSLIIEQLPLYTGIMMSLNRAVTQVGFSLGSGLGGIFLLLYGYQVMFLMLGVLAIASAVVFQWLTVDPSADKIA